MAITNGYCSLAELKAALRIADSIDDALLELAIESASREIDGYTGRHFWSGTATKTFIPSDPFVMDIPDLVSVTSVKSTTQTQWDTLWSAGDYQLEPLNNVVAGLAWPYTRVRAIDAYLFPVWDARVPAGAEASVQIVGVWGWSAVPIAIKQATVILAMRIFKRLDAPLGMITNDMGSMRVGRFDPDVEALVGPYRRISAG